MRGNSPGSGCRIRLIEKVVPIQKYDEVGQTDPHILSGDRVLIVPTMIDPRHPDYPGPGYPTKDFFRDTDKDVKP